MLDTLQHKVALLDDLVALEKLTGKEIEPVPERVQMAERVRLRQPQVLWEGRAVQWVGPRVSPVRLARRRHALGDQVGGDGPADRGG